MNKKIILTGDRPSGELHLGHYIGSLKSRIELQHSHKQYIMIADTQALTDNFENPDKVISNVYNVAMDYISVGIDPSKTVIFIQSQIPELTELTIYYLNLVTCSRLERNPTVKSEIKQKGYENSIPVGFFCYPISQAADITAFQADLVPVGDDQLPMIEQTNEIVRKFNRIYNTNCLKECEAYLSNHPRLVGIDGKNKASKSLGNAILISDSADEIRKKVFQMFTDPNHLKVSDPGSVKNNVVFEYLDAFYENKVELDNLKEHYKKGGLGDTKIKNILNDVLQSLIKPFREKRNTIDKSYIEEILSNGKNKAREIASSTLKSVKNAMGINYSI